MTHKGGTKQAKSAMSVESEAQVLNECILSEEF